MHRISFPYKQVKADRPKSTPVFLTAIAQHSLDGILHTGPVGNDAPPSAPQAADQCASFATRRAPDRSGLAYVCFKSLRPKDKNPELFSARSFGVGLVN